MKNTIYWNPSEEKDIKSFEFCPLIVCELIGKNRLIWQHHTEKSTHNFLATDWKGIKLSRSALFKKSVWKLYHPTLRSNHIPTALNSQTWVYIELDAILIWNHKNSTLRKPNNCWWTFGNCIGILKWNAFMRNN